MGGLGNGTVTEQRNFRLAEHDSSGTPLGEATDAGITENATRTTIKLSRAVSPAEVTDIIPFNEFGDLADLDFRDCTAFDREAQVIHAPELDDMHDTDDLTPEQLAVPTRFRPKSGSEGPSRYAYRDSHTDVSDGTAATDIINIGSRRGGAHRAQRAGGHQRHWRGQARQVRAGGVAGPRCGVGRLTTGAGAMAAPAARARG